MSTSNGANPVLRLVAIDGPVASGKTAVGRALAQRLGWRLFDTGVMYRAATWHALRNEVHLDEAESVADLIREAEIVLRPNPKVGRADLDIFVDGEPATPHLRQPDVESAVPVVAAIAEVRELLVAHQRRQSATGQLVVVGRDIGTVVLPDAPVKIFLTASEEIRAQRRAAQMEQDVEAEAVLRATRRRDARDRGRAASPLIAAVDAITLDTSDLTLEESVDAAEEIVRSRIPRLSQAGTNGLSR